MVFSLLLAYLLFSALLSAIGTISSSKRKKSSSSCQFTKPVSNEDAYCGIEVSSARVITARRVGFTLYTSVDTACHQFRILTKDVKIIFQTTTTTPGIQ